MNQNIKNSFNRSIIADSLLCSNIPKTLHPQKCGVFNYNRVSVQGVKPEFLSIKGIKKLGNVYSDVNWRRSFYCTSQNPNNLALTDRLSTSQLIIFNRRVISSFFNERKVNTRLFGLKPTLNYGYAGLK
jgi:hypothetical protein